MGRIWQKLLTRMNPFEIQTFFWISSTEHSVDCLPQEPKMPFQFVRHGLQTGFPSTVPDSFLSSRSQPTAFYWRVNFRWKEMVVGPYLRILFGRKWRNCCWIDKSFSAKLLRHEFNFQLTNWRCFYFYYWLKISTRVDIRGGKIGSNSTVSIEYLWKPVLKVFVTSVWQSKVFLLSLFY